MTSHIPNAKELAGRIVKIMTILTEEDNLKLLRENFVLYASLMNQLIEKEDPDFVERYYGVLQKLISGEDITKLLAMLVSINKINNETSTQQSEEKQLGEELAETYVYPKLSKSQRKKLKNQ